MTSAPPPILEVTDLAISYKTRKRQVPAVRGVNFKVHEQETVGLVGESGCGKSTIAFGILDFLGINGRIVGGSIKFKGEELIGRSKAELREIRGNQISMVYQDPMQALNPSLTIGRQLTEVLTCHQDITLSEARDRSIAMLERVYMPDAAGVMNRYPHTISGGQQQRVVIAMAMLNEPSLLIMDEPTTALDVTVEAQVLDLIEDLKNDHNTGIIFITHNLGVVAQVSDQLCVMYAGEMVEKGSIDDLFAEPAHPYTRGLLCCIPRLTDDLSFSRLWSIKGRVPHPAERVMNACVFLPRCDWYEEKSAEKSPKVEKCAMEHPGLVNVSKDHQSRCFLGDEPLKVPWNDYSRGKKRLLSDEEASGIDLDEADLILTEDLKVYYQHRSGALKDLFSRKRKRYVKAVDGISLKVKKGHTLGIVGESGCGKSTLVRGIIGLEHLDNGHAELMGVDISNPVRERDWSIVKELQMVFQNPDSTLNPSFSVGQQITRPLRKFKSVPKASIPQEVDKLLKAVKLDGYYYDRLPRQLSGGEKQRVGIARALASRPSVIICDEPVSALDVSVQAAVLNLLSEIKDDFGSTLLFIAHDLSVVRFISDYIAVMYLGQIVEYGPVDKIYDPPFHPYTEALLSAVPVPDPHARKKQIRLSGDVPSALDPPPGCHFNARCPRRSLLPDGGKICEEQEPPKRLIGKQHTITCHHSPEKLLELQD